MSRLTRENDARQRFSHRLHWRERFELQLVRPALLRLGKGQALLGRAISPFGVRFQVGHLPIAAPLVERADRSARVGLARRPINVKELERVMCRSVGQYTPWPRLE